MRNIGFLISGSISLVIGLFFMIHDIYVNTPITRFYIEDNLCMTVGLITIGLFWYYSSKDLNMNIERLRR